MSRLPTHLFTPPGLRICNLSLPLPCQARPFQRLHRFSTAMASNFDGRRRNRKGFRPQDRSMATSSAHQFFSFNSSKADMEDAPSNSATLSRFEDLSRYDIHPQLLQTITQDMKFEKMTPVQAATMPVILAGKDVLAQAKTGTGKTVAFLLPAIKDIVTAGKLKPSSTRLLVITPTRELALQIAQEANTLLTRFPDLKVCSAIGGTNQGSEQKRILRGCHVLVATPGRLLDHLSQEDGAIRATMQDLKFLVLDECDRLLDMGFLTDLRKIIDLLPNKEKTKRQGMLFSATHAPHVTKFASLALSNGYKFITTIKEGEQQTHERVPQHLIIVPNFSEQPASLVGSLRQEMARIGKDLFRPIIFLPTAALVDFYVAILEKCKDLPPISGLHSRMTQSKRTRLTDSYRKAKNGILVATDVVARGIDFPHITNVFQVGLPMDRESYIHRLGRTARAGADGSGILILTTSERPFADNVLRDMKFNTVPVDSSSLNEVLETARSLSPQAHTKAYQAWLGYYKDQKRITKWSPEQLVEQANTFAISGLGAAEIPILQRSTLSKMSLKGIKGIRMM